MQCSGWTNLLQSKQQQLATTGWVAFERRWRNIAMSRVAQPPMECLLLFFSSIPCHLNLHVAAMMVLLLLFLLHQRLPHWPQKTKENRTSTHQLFLIDLKNCHKQIVVLHLFTLHMLTRPQTECCWPVPEHTYTTNLTCVTRGTQRWNANGGSNSA